MRILIVSDSHKQDENLFRVIKKEKKLDLIVHCGDSEGSEFAIAERAECPVKLVLGNNDFFSNLPRELELEIGTYKVWVTHGHNYYVSTGNETIKKLAKSRGFDIVIYGHTHRPVIEEEKGFIAINPGSISYPRQAGRKPTYIVMDVEDNGNTHFALKYV